MLQLTLIVFFLTFTEYFLPLFYSFRKIRRLLFLCPSWHHPFLFCSLDVPFLPHQTKPWLNFQGFFTPFWLSVPFLISCKDFDSYLCSVHEEWIAHYFFQTSFLMPSSILCLVMWIFNEEQFVPHCLLSITLQIYDDSNYLWLGYWYIDTNACHTKLPLSYLCCTPPPPFFCVCLLSLVLYWNYKAFGAWNTFSM